MGERGKTGGHAACQECGGNQSVPAIQDAASDISTPDQQEHAAAPGIVTGQSQYTDGQGHLRGNDFEDRVEFGCGAPLDSREEWRARDKQERKDQCVGGPLLSISAERHGNPLTVLSVERGRNLSCQAVPPVQVPWRTGRWGWRHAAAMISAMRLGWLFLAAFLAGCSSSSSSSDKQTKAAPAVPQHFTATNTSNPIAKYVELVGFRVRERSPGHLVVQFGVVNHSEADVGDVKMTVNLSTTAAKPGDPPLISFPAQVSRLGPSELKDVTTEVPTKLRVYELPDWQFLKADFEIIEPKE
jgi:hypothetical protein